MQSTDSNLITFDYSKYLTFLLVSANLDDFISLNKIVNIIKN